MDDFAPSFGYAPDNKHDDNNTNMPELFEQGAKSSNLLRFLPTQYLPRTPWSVKVVKNMTWDMAAMSKVMDAAKIGTSSDFAQETEVQLISSVVQHEETHIDSPPPLWSESRQASPLQS